MSVPIPSPTARQRWMGVLARASRAELEQVFARRPDLPEAEVIRPAETGTVMLEGRAGGAGQRFNAGEATVTRCVVRVGPMMGFAYCLGRDRVKALLAARLDAVLQDIGGQRDLIADIVDPLERRQSEARDLASRKAAATRVDFFTLVRGD